jgi:effector-binding domain-containing protein
MAETLEPKWESLLKQDNIEIRAYDPMLVAEVTVKGERYAAINQGFQTLAAFIFGENKDNAKIAMTAPVTQTPAKSTDNNEWVVRFVMPAEFTKENLPVPNDPNIKIIENPAFHAAVIRFSGFNTDKNLQKHELALFAFLDKSRIPSLSAPIYAFYNPPWTPPFLKRNEIMVMVAEGE